MRGIIRSAAVIAAIYACMGAWAQEPEAAAWDEIAAWAIHDYDVSIARDGGPEESGAADRGIEVVVAAELPTARLVETVVRSFNGCDWTRSIHWRRGAFLLVTERLQVREAGDYAFASNWSVLPEAGHRLEDGRILTIEQPEQAGGEAPSRVVVKGDGHSSGTLSENTDEVGNRSVMMRWGLGGQLQPDETRTFHTLYYEVGDAQADEWDLRRINDEAVLILRNGEPETVVVMGEEANIPGQVRMKMGAFGRRAIWAANLTDLRGTLRTEQPIHGEVTAEPTTHATVIGPPDLRTISIVGMPLMLQEGRLELDLAGLGDVSVAAIELEALFEGFVARANEPPDAEPGA